MAMRSVLARRGTWWWEGLTPLGRSQRLFWGIKFNIILKKELMKIPTEEHQVQNPSGEFLQLLSSSSVVRLVRSENPYLRQIPCCLCHLFLSPAPRVCFSLTNNTAHTNGPSTSQICLGMPKSQMHTGLLHKEDPQHCNVYGKRWT